MSRRNPWQGVLWSSARSEPEDDKDKWGTRAKLFAELDAELGFGLDVCAEAWSTKVPENWMGPDHLEAWRRDCLGRSWAGLVPPGRRWWMNPPYSQCKLFMGKATWEAAAGLPGAALVFARTGSEWWWSYVLGRDFQTGEKVRMCAAEIRWGQAREKFETPPWVEDTDNSAPGDSALVLYEPGYMGQWPRQGVLTRAGRGRKRR